MHQFFEKINQRDNQLEKRAKMKKMNHLDVKTSKKVKKTRVSGKRDWINAKEEE